MRDNHKLIEYLDQHDLPCPCCGYNLHGLKCPVCPECAIEYTDKLLQEMDEIKEWRIRDWNRRVRSCRFRAIMLVALLTALGGFLLAVSPYRVLGLIIIACCIALGIWVMRRSGPEYNETKKANLLLQFIQGTTGLIALIILLIPCVAVGIAIVLDAVASIRN